MADVSHFNIKIAVDAKSGQATVVGFGNAGKEAVEKIDKASKNASGSFLSFTNMIKGAGIAAIAGLGMQMVKGASELENYATQFEVLTGSAEKGKALFEEIRAFGAATPFETKDLAAATQTMLGFNIAQEQVMGNLQMLGDIAGGDAERLKSLTLTFSQISSAGKLTGGDLLQMINAGFNPLTEISAMTGKSMAELRKEMEKGAISADMVKAAMARATGEGGKFNGMMEKQAKTFQGMLSTLQDTIGALLAEAGAPILELFKAIMPVITPVIEALGKSLQPVIDALVKALKTLLPPFMDLLDKVFKALEPIIGVLVSSLGKLTPVFSKLIVAAGKLVEAAMPMIEMFAELAEDQLDKLIPLLEAVLDLFIAISPAITLVSTMTANLIKMGVGLMTSVVWPLKKAIEWIINTGSAAINVVSAIFGGGGGGKKKPAAKPEAEGGGGGGGEGPQEGDISPDGKQIYRNGKWGPLESATPTGGGKKKEKLVEGSIPAMEAQVKALEALRDKTRAGSTEWANYTLQIAAAQAELDMFKQIADALAGQGPNAKGISPIEKTAKDIKLLEAVAPTIDATTTLVDELAASWEGLADIIAGSLKSIAELVNANFEEMKYFSLAEAIINTATGVTKALAQGGILGIAGAVSVGLAGAAQIKKILSTKPGSTGGGGAPVGQVETGQAPTRGGMTPRRLSVSGATSMPTEIRLVAKGGDLVGAMQVNERQRERLGV